MYCKYCGKELREGAFYCSACGNKMGIEKDTGIEKVKKNIMEEPEERTKERTIEDPKEKEVEELQYDSFSSHNNDSDNKIKIDGTDSSTNLIKKSFYKKVTKGVIGLVVVIILWNMIFGGKEKVYIETIKEDSPYEYGWVNYEDAFKNYFKKPKWKAYKSKRGEHIVEFTGKCLYNGKNVDVCIEFTIMGETKETLSYQMTDVSINDVSQNTFTAYALIDDIFESY